MISTQFKKLQKLIKCSLKKFSGNSINLHIYMKKTVQFNLSINKKPYKQVPSIFELLIDLKVFINKRKKIVL